MLGTLMSQKALNDEGGVGVVLEVVLDAGEDGLAVVEFGHWEQYDFDGVLVGVDAEYLLGVVDGEDLHAAAGEALEVD